MLTFLTSKLGLGIIAFAAVLGTLLFLRADLGIKTHERDQARAELATARSSLAASNASIASHAALSARALASAEKVQAAVQPKAARITAKALVLSVHEVKGETELDRWRDADAAVRASLQP